ncbi:MAG: SH3 domain-containing protein [Cucumibacter sp.]
MKLLLTLLAGASLAVVPSTASALTPFECEQQAQQYAESQYPEGGGAARGATGGAIFGGVFAGLSGGRPLRGALLGGAGGLVVGSALWQQAKQEAHDEYLVDCLQAASASPPAVLPPTPFPSTIMASALNVRSGPGTGYEVLWQLSAGQVFQVLSCEPEWCWIDQNGANGYVAASYLYPLYGG